MIEQIEHLRQGVHAEGAGDHKAARDPHVDAVERFADKIVAWDNRAVRAQAPTGSAGLAEISTIGCRNAFTGSKEVQSAHLKSRGKLHNPVQDCAVALIAHRQAVLTAEIQRNREWGIT